MFFISGRNIRGAFPRNRRSLLILPQTCWHFQVPASKSTCYQKFQQKKFCNQFVSILQYKDTAALKFLRRSEFLQKSTQVFVKQFARFPSNSDKFSNCLQIPLSKPKIETGSTNSKDNHFVHYYRDIIEHPNRRSSLIFRHGNNTSWVFIINKFKLPGYHFILAETVNLNHSEIHQLYKYRCYFAKECEKIKN